MQGDMIRMEQDTPELVNAQDINSWKNGQMTGGNYSSFTGAPMQIPVSGVSTHDHSYIATGEIGFIDKEMDLFHQNTIAAINHHHLQALMHAQNNQMAMATGISDYTCCSEMKAKGQEEGEEMAHVPDDLKCQPGTSTIPPTTYQANIFTQAEPLDLRRQYYKMQKSRRSACC